MDPVQEDIDMVHNGNSWVRKGKTMPNVPVVTRQHEEIAALVPQVWETCIYFSAGRKIILGWLEMSEVAARTWHNDLRGRIKDGVPATGQDQ